MKFEGQSSKLQSLYVDMCERFSSESSFSLECVRASFSDDQQCRAAFLVPNLFEQLGKLPVGGVARRRIETSADLYAPVFAVASNLLKVKLRVH